MAAFYNENGTLELTIKDIEYCYTVFNMLRMARAEDSFVTGAIPFAPLILKDELIMTVFLIKSKTQQKWMGE